VEVKLALIGFVLAEPESDFIFIILCGKGGCIRFVVAEIGFVLHNNIIILWQVRLDRRFGEIWASLAMLNSPF